MGEYYIGTPPAPRQLTFVSHLGRRVFLWSLWTKQLRLLFERSTSVVEKLTAARTRTIHISWWLQDATATGVCLVFPRSGLCFARHSWARAAPGARRAPIRRQHGAVGKRRKLSRLLQHVNYGKKMDISAYLDRKKAYQDSWEKHHEGK